ncbi:MAG: SpoIIE family protein phosphatase, partial [Bacteroidota bacterium]
QDKIDIALCRLERKCGNEVTVSYAGAKQALYYFDVSNKEEGVQKVRGTRRSIGANTKKSIGFEQFERVLPSGSIFYLASDGFSDQHDIEGEKMGSLRFHELLKTASTLPFDKQATEIEKFFNKHRSGQFQRDDVTVLGVQLR